MSLTITLVFLSSFGIGGHISAQSSLTIPQEVIRNLSQLNAIHINASQMQINDSTSNMTSPCDPSYPDFCVTSYSANLSCTDIPFRNFTVENPDTFGLDSDGDGVGCENSNVPFVNSSTFAKSVIVNITSPKSLIK